jgi:hypothetical protein
VIPSGTILRLSLIDALDSDKSQAGDRFAGNLSENLVGGGGGTGVVLATKGHEIHYGPETHLNFTLTNSVEL